MTSKSTKRTTERGHLDQARIVDAAVELADEIGVADLTIRRLADHLGSKPMTLYHHVANKDAILDLMVDAVYAEVGPVDQSGPWQSTIRDRCVRLRDVLVAHPWAVTLLDSRTAPGPATLAHHDATIGCLYANDFGHEGVAHTVALIDAYVFGFVIQETSLPATGGEEIHQLAASIDLMADTHGNLARFTEHHVLGTDYDFTAEFDIGLDLVLDGIERRFAPDRS